jgi:H+-transporting ATPase
VRNIVLASFIPALLYVFGDSIILMAGIFYFHLHLHELTTLVMLSFIFNSQFRVLTVRERKHFWSSMPGRGLLISSASAILGIALIGYFGFLVPSLSLTVVLSVLAFSAFMAFCIDFPKCYLFKKYGL